MDESEQRELREKLERLKKEHSHGTIIEHNVQEGKDARHEEHAKPERSALKGILTNKYVFFAIVAGIIIFDIILRTGLTKYVGFFEPDGFFHYAVILQTIANHYAVPMTQSLSGFPAHNYIDVPVGFYYMVLIPYALLHGFGLSAYTIERYIPVLFGVLDAVGVYFLAKYLTKSRAAGLVAMFLMAISSGDISRTAALVFRGDTFATIFVIVSLIFFVKSMTTKRKYFRYIFAALSGFVLSITSTVWNGAPFGMAVYIFALLALSIYGFIKSDIETIKGSITLAVLGLFLAYLLQLVYVQATIIRGGLPPLGGTSFFILFVPILAGSLLAWQLIRMKGSLLPSLLNGWVGRAMLTGILLLVAVVGIVVAFPNFIHLAYSAVGTGDLGVTIQELQPPTWSFIWESFSYQILLAPVGIVAYALLSRRLIDKEHIRMADYAFMACLVYFAVTMWLQLEAIRYNSLVAAPISIFSGYCVYALPTVFHKKRGVLRFAAFGIMGLFTALLILNAVQTTTNSFSSGQADGIDPQFLQAMAWMYNNTPSNATVLALWPDGSVVEGWAHRQSYMDSVNGQTASKIYNFSRWIFSSTPDPEYLINASRPQYLVVRGYWLAELGGIATEGNITNTSVYGYEGTTGVNISTIGNETVYDFSTGISPYYNVEILQQRFANGSVGYLASLGTPTSEERAPLRYIIFINDSGGPYSVVESSLNNTLNYTFVMNYMGRNITGGSLIGPALPYTNLFKFIFLCNPSYCPYNEDNVSMQVVYQNDDTKIMKITYG